MKRKANKYLFSTIIVGLLFHGVSMFFTLENTYDALIHLFFADHYSSNWFNLWNFKWYTGFTVTGYPPLVHQIIALLSFIGGLKFGLFTLTLISIILFVTGVYQFSLLITSNYTVAGYASLFAVFSTSFAETLHLFGQLPSIIGLSILLHSLPYIYEWLKNGAYKDLIKSLSLIALIVTSHHVTPIFGMIFFIFPLIGLLLMDLSIKQVNSYKEITLKIFTNNFIKSLKRILIFGSSSLAIIILCILPYWINSKNNPITQVPIPHGSRDNFLEITSSGFIFFLIPWGVILILIPYIFYRFFCKRYLFFGLSLGLLTILGFGGTTPIPRLILGETAFNILTLDRFTFWATIMVLPIVGEFIYKYIKEASNIDKKFSYKFKMHKFMTLTFLALFIFTTVFTMSLGYFRPFQPQKIKMLPIVNFLKQDQHYKWRYMTLGFGDQMSWLSAQTNALTVDGNYHSARRLPELTTRAVERLENSKFKGIEGIGSLQQFLTIPEKYNLKYIFSNDKFYDPLLYFCGWQRLRRLENGIMIWEKLNIPPLPSILPKDEIATWQKVHWGLVPLITLVFVLLFFSVDFFGNLLSKKNNTSSLFITNLQPPLTKNVLTSVYIWAFIILLAFLFSIYTLYLENDAHRSPKSIVKSYYNALDFKEFEKSHSFIDPKSNISLSQYLLELSVADGLLSSYAKLESITTDIASQNDTSATVKIMQNWITPLEVVKKTDYKILNKRNSKWYIKGTSINPDLPPDQLVSKNSTSFFNHGRRRITTEQTYHEDVLKQPSLEILSANLVKYNNKYSIVGEIQNIDNIPADIAIEGTLYNKNNKKLATYNAKYHLKHKLMPKEISSFRVDFEGIAWSNIKDSIPKTFNPNEFTSLYFETNPSKFTIHVSSNVSGSDLFKNLAISNIHITKEEIAGVLFNGGIQEITVPQLIISYYDSSKNIIWVDNIFMNEGIRQQRKQHFKYSLLRLGQVEIINSSTNNCFINGLSNKIVSKKIAPNRTYPQITNGYQRINQDTYKYIKIELNNYIATPN